MYQITVDDREVQAGVVSSFYLMENISVEIKRLPLGDYKVGEKLLVERKTIADLFISIKEGRIFEQAQRLASSTIKPVIILEGTYRDAAYSKMRREAIQGALITLSLVFGIPLLRSRGPNETAKLIIYSANQIFRRSTSSIHRQVFRPKGKENQKLFILQGLPNVGSELAKKLLEKFKNVEKVFKANEQELQKVSGLGGETARKIRELLK